MNREWCEARLGDISDINYGFTAKASFEVPGPKFLRITDIQNGRVDWNTVPSCPITDTEYQKHKLDQNDIVFARTGATTGKSYLIQNIPPTSVAASYLIRLRLHDQNVLPEFVSLFFQTPDYWDMVNAGTTGSAQGGFNASKLGDLILPKPPIEEQKRIVAILDEAFAGIDTAIANTEKNLANARELFESYLNNRLNDVVSSKSIQTLACITELIIDCEHKTAPTQEAGYPSIRTPNIGKGYLILDGVKRVSEETYKLWTRRGEPQAGDLILAREAPAGNVGVIPEGERVCLGQRTVLIRPNKEMVLSKYLAHLILHPVMQKRLLSHSTGATVQHVNMRDIRALKLARLPELQKQIEDVEILEDAQIQVSRLEVIYKQKLNSLNELKQSLLQKAFSGELTAEGDKLMDAAVA